MSNAPTTTTARRFTALYVLLVVTNATLWDSLVGGWSADEIAEIGSRAADAVEAGYIAPNQGAGTLFHLTPKGTAYVASAPAAEVAAVRPPVTCEVAAYRPTDEDVAAARRVVSYYARSYSSGAVTLVGASDVAARAARFLAPAVCESAMDSGCTDERPGDYGRRQAAWDCVVLAHVLNAIAP